MKSLKNRLKKVELESRPGRQTIVCSGKEVDGQPCTEVQHWENGQLIFVKRIVGVRYEDV